MLSNTIPLTTSDILDAAHVNYEQAVDTPALTTDDGEIRLNLLNQGINRWEMSTVDDDQESIDWRELWVYNASTSVLTARQVVYPLSQSDFLDIGSQLRCLRTDGTYFYVPIVPQDKFARFINQNIQQACISGNVEAGFQLNLGWVPVANDGMVGATPYFDYYASALHMNALTDIPQMSNPYYLIDFITAELFANDDINLYQKWNAGANTKLQNMRNKNERLPAYMSNSVEDQGDLTGGFAMGV